MAPGLLTSIRGTSGPRWTTMYRETSGPLVNVPSIDVGDLTAPCLLPSTRGTSRPLVYYQVQGDLRAFDECTMYRCGDLGLLLCIGGPQGSLSILHFKRLGSRHIHKEIKLRMPMNWMEWTCVKRT